MRFPRTIIHYGLTFSKIMEESLDGVKILGYACTNIPALGAIRSVVSTWNPNKEYLESVTGSIHFSIAQWIAEYVRSVEILKRDGRDAAAASFFLQEADVAPYDPDSKEWPEVLNHHGLLYWRELEDTAAKDLILKYTCADFPSLGTLKLRVCDANPSKSYKTAVLANIMNSINQYLTDYVVFLEDLRKKTKQGPIFTFSDPGTSDLTES